MIALKEDMRIMVAFRPGDFRCGIDGFAARCRSELKENPRSGTLFVWRNRHTHSVKILAWNGRGFWLSQFRLSSGKFPRWPRSSSDTAAIQMLASELRALLFSAFKNTSSLQWQPVSSEPEGLSTM